jgi:uncharacterized peroxidase-related enzyme
MEVEMNRYRIHTPETASAPAARTLQAVHDSQGFIPNILGVIAESSPALTAIVELNSQLANTSLSALERELIQTLTSVENQCSYCVAGHTAFAAKQDLPADVIEAARSGRPIPDARLEALRKFTRTLSNLKGRIAQSDLDEFYDAGYGPQQVLEVILGVCAKMFSNLASNVTGVPLDDEFLPYSWQPNASQTKTNTAQAV